MRATLVRLCDRAHPSLWAVLAGYLLLIVARLVDAAVTDPSLATALAVIFEVAIFAVPGGLCWLWQRRAAGGSRPDSLWLVRPSARRIPICAAALVGLACLGTVLTVLLRSSDAQTGSFELYRTFLARPDGTAADVIRLTLCYALLPAVCEELMFRGLICRDYRGDGAVVTLLISSLLFGLLHLDARLLPLYIISGAVLCLLLYATRSLGCCIAVHLLYNMFGIFVQPYLTALYQTTGSRALFLMISVALLLLAAAVFCVCAARLYRARDDSGVDYPTALTPSALLETLRQCVISLPLWLCAIIFVIGVMAF